MEKTSKPSSPGWGTNTKLVVALTTVVVIGALLVKFQFIITPLVMAFLLSYLFHPIAQTALLVECISQCDLFDHRDFVGGVAHAWRSGIGTTGAKPGHYRARCLVDLAAIDR